MIFIQLKLFYFCIILLSNNVYAHSSNCTTIYLNKDFSGHDLTFKKGQVDDCCKFCAETRGCKGYSWTDYGEGGECWLKYKMGEIIDKDGVLSGIIDKSTPVNLYNIFGKHPGKVSCIKKLSNCTGCPKKMALLRFFQIF
jgi:hypothetical protein